MEIKTKYDLDQRVFIIQNFEIKSTNINGIHLSNERKGNDMYDFRIELITIYETSFGDYLEVNLFETKELAKKYLKDKIDQM